MMTSCYEGFKYNGSIDCFNQILKNEGFMSLMKGAGVSVLRSVAGGVVLVSFDKFQALYMAWRTTSRQV